jgi:serine protease
MPERWPGAYGRASAVLISLVVLGGLLAIPAARSRADTGHRSFAASQVLVHYQGRPGEKLVRVPRDVPVASALKRLRGDPEVAYANRNYLVRAAAHFSPNDPGSDGRGHWYRDQWNFLSPRSVAGGIDVPRAWAHLIAAGDAGARDVTVAVLDTGVAYRRMGHRFRRDPDLPPRSRFVHPRDFVGDDQVPLDRDGHGTHVASTIVQATNNGLGLTGIGYGVDVMPIRVLNRREVGTAQNVARGIRFAKNHGADVINLSLEFNPTVSSCDQIVKVCQVIRGAINHGIVVVAAAGNHDEPRVAYPAATGGVIAVGATTYRGCAADYSDYGNRLDLAAPGGGNDKDSKRTGDPGCAPSASGFEVRQYSLDPAAADAGNYRDFGIVGLEGTSMASAHVSGTVAALIGAGVCGARPSPADVTQRLESTARDRGVPGRDDFYGYGLINAGRATDTRIDC